jgi:hypothetical protein
LEFGVGDRVGPNFIAGAFQFVEHQAGGEGVTSYQIQGAGVALVGVEDGLVDVAGDRKAKQLAEVGFELAAGLGDRQDGRGLPCWQQAFKPLVEAIAPLAGGLALAGAGQGSAGEGLGRRYAAGARWSLPGWW